MPLLPEHRPVPSGEAGDGGGRKARGDRPPGRRCEVGASSVLVGSSPGPSISRAMAERHSPKPMVSVNPGTRRPAGQDVRQAATVSYRANDPIHPSSRDSEIHRPADYFFHDFGGAAIDGLDRASNRPSPPGTQSCSRTRRFEAVTTACSSLSHHGHRRVFAPSSPRTWSRTQRSTNTRPTCRCHLGQFEADVELISRPNFAVVAYSLVSSDVRPRRRADGDRQPLLQQVLHK